MKIIQNFNEKKKNYFFPFFLSLKKKKYLDHFTAVDVEDWAQFNYLYTLKPSVFHKYSTSGASGGTRFSPDRKSMKSN